MHLTVVWSADIYIFFLLLFTISPATLTFCSAPFSIYTCQKDTSERWDPARPLEMVLNVFFFFHIGEKKGVETWQMMGAFSKLHKHSREREKSSVMLLTDASVSHMKALYFPLYWASARWALGSASRLSNSGRMLRCSLKKGSTAANSQQPRGKLPNGRCKKIAACFAGT